MDLGTAISEQYISNRKLKERHYEIETTKAKRILIGFDLDDYPRVDPVPSSKATIKNGPIEHGTPVMPYISTTHSSKPSYSPARVTPRITCVLSYLLQPSLALYQSWQIQYRLFGNSAVLFANMPFSNVVSVVSMN
ncbi:uncharacterized protein LOC120250225 [Dioscorea cayenensis subsp. rotundata]|uniref:Uncharacterized protein LOC120250225 n=1 Tax=Dioscorea cayennensis subsp. rotundata TaxID=55577 RepID=A0AB40AJB9_DIOCR|nr:uncharacterized protein LOC120250225 [Dioscorea cayenensis subsp. rotundata]